MRLSIYESRSGEAGGLMSGLAEHDASATPNRIRFCVQVNSERAQPSAGCGEISYQPEA